MASVAVNRVMGQGEQQTLLPFFRLYPRNADRNANEAPTNAKQSEPTTIDLIEKYAEPRHLQADSRDQLSTQLHLNCQYAALQGQLSPHNASLDEDSDSNRRKRSRSLTYFKSGSDTTNQLIKTQATQSLQTSPGMDAKGVREVQPHREVIEAKTRLSSYDGEEDSLQASSGKDADGTVDPEIRSEPQGLTQTAVKDVGSTNATGTQLPNTEEKFPARKMLKLNPNGKLLSSPPAVRFEDKSQKKPQNKRKIATKEAKDTKIAVIKYAGAGALQKIIGGMIDDIILGNRRHPPPSCQTVPTSTVRTLKPTHPFFLKIPSRKEEQPTPISNTIKETNQTPMFVDNNREKVSQNPRDTVQFITPLLPKHPESIVPLWPPRDLVHVRGVEPRPSPDANAPVPSDRRKDKDSVVTIGDSENVLLAEMRRSQDAETATHPFISSIDSGVLRIPKRHVASGVVLRKGMNSQLSHHTVIEKKHPNETSRSSSVAYKRKTHASVARLYSALPSAMSAFDTGGFDTHQWTQKYAPTCAEEVLQVGPEAVLLRNWLRALIVSTVDTGKSSKDKHMTKQSDGKNRKAKRRKTSAKLDGFIVSSSDEESEMDELSEPDEDELAGDVTTSFAKTVVRAGDPANRSRGGDDKGRLVNAVLISGPPGCGKTASVYAVAKELDFEVFEVNSGSRRSARDLLERVGDMTRNHLVHNLEGKEGVGDESSEDIQSPSLGPINGKQSMMNSFFTSAPKANSRLHGQKKQKVKNHTEKALPLTLSQSQRQSLILLEEADILFEDDKQFWIGVLALISQSKRPIVITCSNENLIPLQDLSLHAILRYRPPIHDLAVDYLLLIAANEGHMLKREAVSDLYSASNQDLRKSIMELSFWCQMGVGSKKSGLDWIIDRYPRGSDVDEHGNTMRVISLNTYQRFMGWFNRDIILSKSDLSRHTELLLENMNWWQLDLPHTRQPEGPGFFSSDEPKSPEDAKRACFDALCKTAGLADSQSMLDVLSRGRSSRQEEDELDTSISDIPEKQRANFIESYPVLHAECKPDYTGLSADIGSTTKALMRQVLWDDTQADSELCAANRVLERITNSRVVGLSKEDFVTAFEPIMRADNQSPLLSGRTASSFENGMAAISEDIAPYIRGIITFDLRLERYRHELNSLMSQGSNGKRNARTTRASRAALEGGDKANVRRERWFPRDANPSRILATGLEEWQDILARCGYFGVPFIRPERRGSNHSGSESSGDGCF